MPRFPQPSFVPRLLRRSGALTALAVLVAALCALPARAQTTNLLSQFEDQVTDFTLGNGLTFVVIERHDAPVVSFVTYADVGSVDEPMGETGIAHMFEHMAFKGTTTVGTTDIATEEDLLAQQEELAQALRRERAKGARADTARINELEEEFGEATDEAKSVVDQNAFDRILNQAGATGMNASTASDATRYFYSLPANKVELFFGLESDRFKHPVLREFYTERDVVMEERRLRTESSPQGRLIEEFLAAAFKAHPYGEPTVGHMSDLHNITRTQAQAFFDKYYVPANLTIAIAGDVDPQNMRRLAQKYFGDLEGGTPPTPVTTTEPEQNSERRVILREQSQPLVAIGYHRPNGQAPEDPAYTVLQDVLSGGRTSRLYEALVESEKALAAQAISSFPGSKYPDLFVFFGLPSSDVGPEDLEEGIYAVIDEVKENGITQEELERAQTRARVNLINGLDSNTGLALQLSQYQQLTGDWRNAFREVERIQNVTAAQVQAVARETFKRSNRTVAMIKNASGDESTAAAE